MRKEEVKCGEAGEGDGRRRRGKKRGALRSLMRPNRGRVNKEGDLEAGKESTVGSGYVDLGLVPTTTQRCAVAHYLQMSNGVSSLCLYVHASRFHCNSSGVEEYHYSFLLPSQPAPVACKMEAQLECIYIHCIFCAFGTDLHPQSALISKKKNLHRSSVGSLLRVRCWLGSPSIVR